jgi:signal transduction histidine kinase/ligand-binding sensor domain-containing protein
LASAPFHASTQAWRAFSCTVALLVGYGALAIDSTEYLSELHHTQWTTREGAPGAIAALAQSKDGYLWLGTPIGLFRFDGESFEHPAFPDGGLSINGDVSALYTTPSGDLWIGMTFGGAYLLRNGRLTQYTEAAGLPRHTVRQFAVTRDGAMWAALTNGLFRFNGDRWEAVGANWNYQTTGAYNILADRSGTLWARSADGTFFLADGSKAFQKSPVRGGRGWILAAPDGAVWVSDPEQGLISLSKPGRATSVLAPGYDPGGQTALFDRDGGLWIVLEHNKEIVFSRIPNPRKLWTDSKPFATSDIQTLRSTQSLTGDPFNFLEDREGNLWLATDGGLDRFRPNKLHSALGDEPLAHQAVMALSPEGDLIIAAFPKLLLRFSANQITPSIDLRFNLPDEINALYSGSNNGLWLGMEQVGLGHYSAGTIAAMPLSAPDKSRDIQAITEDHSGALWVSSIREGLFRYREKAWSLNGGIPGLPMKVPVNLFTDSAGKLWLGYTDSEIAVVDGGHSRMLGPTQGLNVGIVLAIASHADRVWIGGNENASLYQSERFWPLTRTDGAAFTGVSGIAEDDTGGLWLNGSTGVIHIDPAEVNAFSKNPTRRVNAETLNFEDGLNGIASQIRPLNNAVKSADGRVWFTTSAGAYWIDPKHIRKNPVPPAVLLRTVKANGLTYALGADVALPVHSTSLEFQFTATSLSIPARTRFKYKLEGVDADWQDAGNRRQAFYTNVSPGPHRFAVIAANEDGVWNQTGAAANITIAPAFYQTRWFYAACAFAALAMLWQLYRLRVGLLARQMGVRLGARLEERERIARELHDTLLQSTQGLILLFQGFAGRLAGPDPMRLQMESALDQADLLLNEARDRVSDLRTTGINSDITGALTRFAEELFTDTSVACKILATGSPVTLTLSAADDIYRIGREGLGNAAAHSCASNIEVEIAYEAEQLRMCIRDDGIGITSEILQKGARAHHFGLQGMRERAERIGGVLRIWSREAAGTELELTVPATKAYDDYRAKRAWIRRLLDFRGSRD